MCCQPVCVCVCTCERVRKHRCVSVCLCACVRACVVSVCVWWCTCVCVYMRACMCARVTVLQWAPLRSVRASSQAPVLFFTSHVWSSLTGILQSVGDIYLLNFANNGTASLRPVRTQKNRVKWLLSVTHNADIIALRRTLSKIYLTAPKSPVIWDRGSLRDGLCSLVFLCVLCLLVFVDTVVHLLNCENSSRAR